MIGKALVKYIFYKGGTVDIQTTCSNNPYRLESEEDRFCIIEFLGQIRPGLLNLLHDVQERVVSDVLEWQLTECDINKDIKVSDLLHFSGVMIQVKHLDHIFRIYIKALGEDTVCRVEENRLLKKPVIEFINDIFNPLEGFERLITNKIRKLDLVCDRFERLPKILRHSQKGLGLGHIHTKMMYPSLIDW